MHQRQHIDTRLRMHSRTQLPHAKSWRMVARKAVALLALLLTALAPVALNAQTTRATPDLSLDSLLHTRIGTASKYLQTSAEAPASVTILSAEEIRNQGYTNLLQALESIPGMYVSDDRNYPYLGTRGFSRPTDYNNRILVLIDGHTLNEQVFGGAPVGSDLPINLAAIERIEVVRGPGSAVYGSSAMFAVINIVTKTGTAIDGASVSARVGSGQSREVALVAGHALGTVGSYALSGLVMRAEGNDLHFAEFDTSAAYHGIARHVDWERGFSGVASLVLGNTTGRIGYVSRSKGIPTASFGTIFGDARAETTDESFWGDVSVLNTPTPTVHITARAYFDRGDYHGAYPYETDATFTDRSTTSTVGMEAVAVWDASSHNRFTFGGEFRGVGRAVYETRDEQGKLSSDDAAFSVNSLFLQNEVQLFDRGTFVSGVRVDGKSGRAPVLVPRLALLLVPDAKGDIKLLYGEAYRTPSAFEGDLDADYYTRNYGLRPERIRTYEVKAERRVADPLVFGASLYDYSIHNLVEQTTESGNRIRYDNLPVVRGTGLELETQFHAHGPLALRAAYAWQRTKKSNDDQALSNSPEGVFHLTASADNKSGLHGALTFRYESGRRTLVDTSTPAFARTDVTIGYRPSTLSIPDWARNLDLSLRVTNALDAKYFVPGGPEHTQSMLPQARRTLSLRVGLSR